MPVCPFAGVAGHIYCLAPFACAAAESQAAMHAVHSGCPRPPAPASWAANFRNGSEASTRARAGPLPRATSVPAMALATTMRFLLSHGDASRPLCVSAFGLG